MRVIRMSLVTALAVVSGSAAAEQETNKVYDHYLDTHNGQVILTTEVRGVDGTFKNNDLNSGDEISMGMVASTPEGTGAFLFTGAMETGTKTFEDVDPLTPDESWGGVAGEVVQRHKNESGGTRSAQVAGLDEKNKNRSNYETQCDGSDRQFRFTDPPENPDGTMSIVHLGYLTDSANFGDPDQDLVVTLTTEDQWVDGTGSEVDTEATGTVVFHTCEVTNKSGSWFQRLKDALRGASSVPASTIDPISQNPNDPDWGEIAACKFGARVKWKNDACS